MDVCIKKKNKKYKNYNISKGTYIIMVLVTIMGVLIYALLSYYANNKPSVLASVLQDVLLVIVSISGTNLLCSAIVEVKSKNALITDVMANGIVSDPLFYNNLSVEDKEKIFYALEYSLFSKNDLVEDIYKQARKKLGENFGDYYYQTCEYVVSSTISDAYIEKRVTKKVSIKSYDKSYIIKNFNFGSFKSIQVQDLAPFEIVDIKINGKKITDKNWKYEEDSDIQNLDEQNKYNSSKKCVYKKALQVYNNTTTDVIVTYITRTSIDDRFTSFRVGRPCKNFSLLYDIKQHNKYRLAVDAYGFLDDADSSTNNSSSSCINIKFSDWIFKHDGVSVITLDKR